MRFPRADFPMQTNLPGPIPKGVFYVDKFSSQHFSQKIKRNIPNLQRRCGNRTKSSPWKVGCFPQKLAVNTVFSRAWVLDSRLLSKGTLYNSPCQATRNLRVFNGWFRCSIDLMMTTLALRSCQSCDTWGQSPDPRLGEKHHRIRAVNQIQWDLRNISHVFFWKVTFYSWWFQTFFIFTPNWGRFPFWLIFFRWVETTN